ncbi:MAG: hypothetical protein ACR2NA_11135 [Solirubrobacterales bacterium]
MAVHMTPSELADRMEMDRGEVIRLCLELGVPIHQGRIDRTLLAASLAAIDRQQAETKAA